MLLLLLLKFLGSQLLLLLLLEKRDFAVSIGESSVRGGGEGGFIAPYCCKE